MDVTDVTRNDTTTIFIIGVDVTDNDTSIINATAARNDNNTYIFIIDAVGNIVDVA